jgi:hypothetical protein
MLGRKRDDTCTVPVDEGVVEDVEARVTPFATVASIARPN